MKTTKKVISLVLTLALVVSLFSVSVFSTSAAAWNNYSKAAHALDVDYAYDGELGALYNPEATTFRVWAPLATEVKLNRYATGSDKEAGAENLGTTEMEKLMDGDRFTGVWTVTVEGNIAGTYYTYTITNPDHIYNSKKTVTKETQDIYSYAVGVNGDRSMVVDLSATDPEGWNSDAHVFTDKQSEAIIWEVQVKDFSFNPNSGVSEANRGKFLGFTETGTTLNNEGKYATGIDYLKELGVTHVQINPFYDFATVNEAIDNTNQFNWGYDPKNYGVPEGSFSSNPYDGNVRINECKQMIQALHEAGIGVIMDVVYNHTYSYDSCFNYSVPEYYYRMTASGGYSNQSGCGNDTASERAMYRKYMRDMLAYWTNEYHIDGYRFDLMGVHDGETMTMIREDMDAIDPRIIMYGEGWSGGTVYDPETCSGTATYMTSQDNAKKLPSRIGFFNDQIRDGIKGGVFNGPTAKGFVNGDRACGSDVSFGIRANSVGSARWRSTSPEQTVTYASCHDNMTLYDKLAAADQKSAAIDYRKRYAGAIKANKLSAAIINTSQGIDFFLAGEEMGRSKDGDENSYKSAPTLNMIDWSLVETNADLVSYYKGLIELRKAFAPFTANVADNKDDSYDYNVTVNPADPTNYVSFVVDDHAAEAGKWNKVAVLYNGNTTDATIKLNASGTTTENTEWVIVADGSAAGVTKLGENKGLSFDVPATTAIVAVEKSSFEQANIKSQFSMVKVNNITQEGDLISSSTLLGKPGDGYKVVEDDAIPIKYELDSVEGSVEGSFSEEETVVNFIYKDFVPSSLLPENGDVDDDGKVSVIDATKIQKHLANVITLDAEHLKRGDYDYDKTTSVIDARLLQRYLAKMNVAVCTVTSNFDGTDKSGKERKVNPSVVQEYRLGSEYKTEPASVAYYMLDATPANASGIVSGNVEVNYHYTYHIDNVTIHVKHGGALTWTPYLWAWATGDINAFNSWPGYAMKDPDENGWATTTFPVPGGLDYFIIISNNGSDQTSDVGPISFETYPEIWVVIDDSNVVNGTEFIKYYNYNPDTAN